MEAKINFDDLSDLFDIKVVCAIKDPTDPQVSDLTVSACKKPYCENEVDGAILAKDWFTHFSRLACDFVIGKSLDLFMTDMEACYEASDFEKLKRYIPDLDDLESRKNYIVFTAGSQGYQGGTNDVAAYSIVCKLEPKLPIDVEIPAYQRDFE